VEFFKETFDRVNLDWDGTEFMNPVWERISIKQIFSLLNIYILQKLLLTFGVSKMVNVYD
jgi:hypothetical protein